MSTDDSKPVHRCLFCRTPFADGWRFGDLLPAWRIAFDPGRGRIWVVCDSCYRWNLWPSEERGGALSTLERVAGDRGPESGNGISRMDFPLSPSLVILPPSVSTASPRRKTVSSFPPSQEIPGSPVWGSCPTLLRRLGSGYRREGVRRWLAPLGR